MRDRVEREEVEKWLKKLEERKDNLFPLNERGAWFIENINAYIQDCRHFMEKGDMVLAFEAIVWAWAWYEIGKELKLIKD